MKELGYIDSYYATKRENKWHRIKGKSYIRYIEPFEDELKIVKYNELQDSILFCKTKDRSIRGKECLYASDWSLSSPMWIYPDDEIYFKRVWIKLTCRYSFNKLAEDMDHKEFIEYMKDCGLTVCPIIK